MLLQITKRLKSKLDTFTGRNNLDNGVFGKRLMHRHQVFWGTPNAELVRNVSMRPDATLDDWKSVDYWQRKLSNKYNARLFAQLHGCRVPELYWKGRDLNKLNFKDLPDQYVIRPTIGHSCNLVFLMDKQYNHMDKRTYTEADLRDVMAAALAKDPHQEFLIEEFVRSEQGEYGIPKDFKIWTFNGQIAAITVINRTSPKGGLSNSYDENWNVIEDIGFVYEPAPRIEPPACLNEMLNAARKLSKAYEIFVRIDFYATDKGAVFGEFTPTPGRGRGYTPNSDKRLASYWDNYCKGMI